MAFSIFRKQIFSPTTFLWEVEAPDMAAAAHPGQFVMLRLHEGGERIPLTVADFDRDRGTITMVVKVVGKTTEEMATYLEGDTFQDFIGPLGAPTHIAQKGHVVFVGGGLGVAPIYPVLRAFKKMGNRTTTIVGFRNEQEIFWKDRFEEFSDNLIVMTDDGSVGKKGTTADALKDVLETGVNIDEVFTVGPLGMMEVIAELTRSKKIPTFASMNSIMVDGIGMCGSCRVTVDGNVLFACVDGPDMDAHKVDFKEMKIRQKRFRNEEGVLLQKYHTECRAQTKGVSA
ncbi:MAG: sulfide/dihydroorotate dehydrogenase-like FAD/NAD-binding protein [Deltaproteobacteria bacterium]|nr:MAG: sulfide/dihydroorotate dehydrogenase-like FAD/NAD-binding protein [Deltaproteobacteria bacterium]